MHLVFRTNSLPFTFAFKKQGRKRLSLLSTPALHLLLTLRALRKKGEEGETATPATQAHFPFLEIRNRERQRRKREGGKKKSVPTIEIPGFQHTGQERGERGKKKKTYHRFRPRESQTAAFCVARGRKISTDEKERGEKKRTRMSAFF